MRVKQKNQRFKIEVVKKNVKRIQSTPQKLLTHKERKINKGECISLSRMKSEKRLKQTLNNQQSPRLINSRHFVSKSELPFEKPTIVPYFYECEFGIDSAFFNDLIQKHLQKENKVIQQLQIQQQDKNNTEPRKITQNGNKKKDRKSHFLNNPFQNMSIVKCQSITLVSASRKNRTGLRSLSNLQKGESSISRRKIKIANVNNSRIMCFNLSSDPDAIYMKKFKMYLDFCFKVNFSNRMFINLDLKDFDTAKKYKAYVGWGNHNQVIKYCIRKRFWFELTDKIQDSQIRFCWTPYPVKGLYERQKDQQCKHEQCPLINIKRPKTVEEQGSHNQKILIGRYCHKVQNFIMPDGYIPPFSQYKSPSVMTNHLSSSACIGQKKRLFRSLFQYYNNSLKQSVFSILPVTYTVSNAQDLQFKRFLRDNQDKPNKIWIVKPGQNTNRGEGIYLARTQQVESYLCQGNKNTYVIQAYIDRPLLYHGRKFDIRHFILITSINSNIKAYWFKQGYIRTSSEFFDLGDLSNKFIHLTNDAVQQTSSNYSVYQPANKISYSQFQRYLDLIFVGRGVNFQNDILKQMKQIACNLVKANYRTIDSKKKQANFQLFGLDFMIDRDLKPWLIEVNQNPCLETNCHLLSRIIPCVIENTFRLCIDPLFLPVSHFPAKYRSHLNDHYLRSLKYEIIFDQLIYEDKKQSKLDVFNMQTF